MLLCGSEEVSAFEVASMHLNNNQSASLPATLNPTELGDLDVWLRSRNLSEPFSCEMCIAQRLGGAVLADRHLHIEQSLPLH